MNVTIVVAGIILGWAGYTVYRNYIRTHETFAIVMRDQTHIKHLTQQLEDAFHKDFMFNEKLSTDFHDFRKKYDLKIELLRKEIEQIKKKLDSLIN